MNKEKIQSVYKEKEKCPVYAKYLLTINEAAQYFNIGENKLRTISDEHLEEEDSFVVMNGSKRLINRKKFEHFIDITYSI